MTYQNEDVIEIFRLIGLNEQDKIVIGEKRYRKPINTILDIPKFSGRKDVYITPNPIKDRRLKVNVLRYVTSYSDLDFKNYDWAMCEADNIMAIMEDYGFYYGLMCSGRGLQLYVPINIDDLSMGSELNRVLNKSILRDYYLSRIIDTSLITNYATFLRLPNTINSKNGKMASVIHHNFDRSIDYFSHNYEILLTEHKNFINNPPKPLKRVANPTKFNFSHGSFRSELMDRMIKLDLEVIHAIREKRMDRELNDCLFPNLATYVYGNEQKMKGASEFVCQVHGDQANLKRWLDRIDESYQTGEEEKRVRFNAKALLNWAERHFGQDHVITALARNDFIRLKFHNGYHKFFDDQPHYDSVKQMRKEMTQFVDKNKDLPGFHWIIGETGLGKTQIFERLIRDGMKVVTLVPYLMLKNNLDRESVYTYDSISFNSFHRLALMENLLNADVIVVDEAHCLKTFRSISDKKAKILDLLEETIRQLVCHERKPVFLLTSTPSVEQISSIQDQTASKYIGFLAKDKKRVSIHIIDKDSLENAVKKHDKVLIFIDHKKEVEATRTYLQTIGIQHTIFTVTKDVEPEEKQYIERQIKTLDKYVIIGTSSVSSGINIPLDTIIFTNRMMNQQTIYQAMGRLRIINKLDQVHPIYIVNQPKMMIPNWEKSMDLFEFVSSNVLIKYISKLYQIEKIKHEYRTIVTSFNRLNKTADLVKLIKSTKHISEFYELPEVQAKKLYLIPVSVMNELGNTDWLDRANWANLSFKDIRNLGSQNEHPHGRKLKCRNKKYGYDKVVWHYFDPIELYRVCHMHPDKPSFFKTLPRKVRKIISSM